MRRNRKHRAARLAMATPATGISGKLSDVCGMGAVVLAGAGVVLLVVVLFVVLNCTTYVTLLVKLLVFAKNANVHKRLPLAAFYFC